MKFNVSSCWQSVRHFNVSEVVTFGRHYSFDAESPISIDIASTPQQLHLVGSVFVTFTCERLSNLVVPSDSTAWTPTPQQQHHLVDTSIDIASTPSGTMLDFEQYPDEHGIGCDNVKSLVQKALNQRARHYQVIYSLSIFFEGDQTVGMQACGDVMIGQHGRSEHAAIRGAKAIPTSLLLTSPSLELK